MSNGDIIVDQGLVHEGIPSVSVDNTFAQVRVSKYGEIMNLGLGSKRDALVAEGGYYTFVNATLGTAIADGNASGFVTTTPTLLIFNGNAAGGKSVYLDFLNLLVTTAAGTSSTNFQAAWYVDTGNRLTSGGTTITAKNANINSSNTSGAVITFGAITATAANAQRQLWNEILRSVIPVLGDKYKFRFGETSPAASGMPTEGTLQLEKLIECPPIVIPPQCSAMLYTFGASQGTARQHTFNGAYAER